MARTFTKAMKGSTFGLSAIPTVYSLCVSTYFATLKSYSFQILEGKINCEMCIL